jgi:hypothetical protein
LARDLVVLRTNAVGLFKKNCRLPKAVSATSTLPSAGNQKLNSRSCPTDDEISSHALIGDGGIPAGESCSIREVKSILKDG